MGNATQLLLGIVVKLALVLLKLLLVILVLGILLQTFTWYVSRSAEEFCDNLTNSDNLESVLNKAEALGYRSFSYQREDGLLVKVPTQDSPFFRMACVVTFTDGVISAKEVVADD